MRNFLISAAINIVLIFASYFVFKNVLSGPTRHRLYEKFFSSLSKFIIYLFIITVVITGLTAFILYKTRFIAYVNVVAPSLLSLLVGFIMSTVPTRGSGDKNKKKG
ncbi:VanZ family protein [Clostridium tetanomorphum]|uniref:Uncharacterized protein n=1 Tax=Clostridium tetanomorphum TaxID=1553 RepID=A0A923ED41_CLOTT|nr:hypothetical protein [Clostridium tetanomorphum]KAJ48999.1 hypothetical protein CTM_25474 [Clostridium tetanomorphum DSM 665]KAJ50837.1 hypothetical protein CTM_15822 [Clostridium tetanomorphum DSM 665]MBC2398328.1 hypothetical protein [Clostridium tetanomorphum]MBP1865480.1 VanZ family protein [Clostridium tetanomorphum]NRS86426.1 VanZ family protein [Clostridium tetanomorphum]